MAAPLRGVTGQDEQAIAEQAAGKNAAYSWREVHFLVEEEDFYDAVAASADVPPVEGLEELWLATRRQRDDPMDLDAGRALWEA